MYTLLNTEGDRQHREQLLRQAERDHLANQFIREHHHLIIGIHDTHLLSHITGWLRRVAAALHDDFHSTPHPPQHRLPSHG